MMKTFQLKFEPVPDAPELFALTYTLIDVAFREVIQNGVHPNHRDAQEKEMCELLLEKLNQPQSMFPDLKEQGYSVELSESIASFPYYKPYKLAHVLEYLQRSVAFAHDLDYDQLLACAKGRLRQHWTSSRASQLLKRSHPHFDELRRFLKSKNPQLKLSSYEDVERLDLAALLGVDDFAAHENLLIEEGLPYRNFRTTSILQEITDEAGRLRLLERIPHFRLTFIPPQVEQYEHVHYAVRCEGETARLTPSLVYAPEQREWARRFAQRWREDQGRYVFTCSIERLEAMAKEEGVKIEFPSLSKQGCMPLPRADGDLARRSLRLYRPAPALDAGANLETLRNALRKHGVSMSGRKEQLLEKLAQLAAQRFEELQEVLQDYFGQRRFIRVQGGDKKDIVVFPLLEDDTLGGLLVEAYIHRHLRGGSILDPERVNDAYSLQDLMRAVIHNKIELEGPFLEVE